MLLAALAALCFLLYPKPAYATETVHTITDESTVFDSSVVIYDTQPGTVTWESVPDGWVQRDFDYENYVSAGGVWVTFPLKALQYPSSDYYPGGDATAVALCEKVGKVNGKWISVRLTFSNIQSTIECYDKQNVNGTTIGLCENIWDGIWLFSLDSVDMKIELLDYESGEPISLKGAWYTGSSLNAMNGEVYSGPYAIERGESIRYVTQDDYDSYTKQTNGLKHNSDGTWEGHNFSGIDWVDLPGGKNFLASAVAFGIVDDAPTFRLGTGNWRRGKATFGFSPLTLSVVQPTKSASIGGETTALQAVEDGTYTIYSSVTDNRVLDVTDGSTSNGAKIQSWESNGTEAQQWEISTNAAGISTIVNVKSGKALDIESGNATALTRLQIYTPNGTEAQQWRIVPYGDGYQIVSVKNPDLVIDLANSSTEKGAAIQIQAANGKPAQTWNLVKVG